MSERTLIFHRATLPDDTVLLANPSVLTVTAVSRNEDGAIVGSHVVELDPWEIGSYELGFGEPTGQQNYRHRQLTVFRGHRPETIEVAGTGEITVAGMSVNEDGHRTQPHTYRVTVEGLDGIDVSAYTLRPTGRSSVVLGLVVGKQAAVDEHGYQVGWLPVYDAINAPEIESAVITAGVVAAMGNA